MPTDVIMPALGMAQETGKVLQWLRAEGDVVAKGQPLLEIETDKVTVELESPADGTLAGIRAAEGADVPVGEAVAVVLAVGETLDAVPAPVRSPARPILGGDDGRPASLSEHPGRPLASPKARRIATERGIELAGLVGSGPGGSVVAADVETAPAPVADSPGSVWKLMAARVTRSWQSVPHFQLRREVDATRLQSWREAARARPGSEAVSHTDLLVELVAEALRRHPHVNATWQDGAATTSDRVNVAIAVATADALVAPVVHDADRLELAGIAARRKELVSRAREGRLRPGDVSGGTFTISNLGMYGVDSFDAIVNAPQVAILAAGRIVERVVPVDGLPAVRPTMQLCVSFDHRAVDGARGASFLETLADLIEGPAGL